MSKVHSAMTDFMGDKQIHGTRNELVTGIGNECMNLLWVNEKMGFNKTTEWVTEGKDDFQFFTNGQRDL